MGFRIITVEDTVRVPPNRFSEPVEEVIVDLLNKNYCGAADKDVGVVLAITGLKEVGVGRVIMGDGASYHDVVFEALVYKPEVNELVMGEVVEIVEFGAFIRIGPVDGLVHVSQVMDDFVGYDKKKGVLYGKESKRVLKEGDRVLARIVTVSLKRGAKGEKIGLTMRQPGLGKPEWSEKGKEGKA
ncbi:MAG: DNA-directed RNA polymerase [Candidatus Hadarchaeales archaeon]